MTSMNSHPGLIYRGGPGHAQSLGEESPQEKKQLPVKREEAKPKNIINKDIVIPEGVANKAIKAGVSGAIGVGLGYVIDQFIDNKPISWFLIGSVVALGYEFMD